MPGGRALREGWRSVDDLEDAAAGDRSIILLATRKPVNTSLPPDRRQSQLYPGQQARMANQKKDAGLGGTASCYCFRAVVLGRARRQALFPLHMFEDL